MQAKLFVMILEYKYIVFIWFFKADKAIFSSLFRNFAFMAKYCWSSALKSMAHNNIAHDIVGKKTKHSLLFRVQPKASETYWMEITKQK